MKSIINDAENPFDASYKPPRDFDSIKPPTELTEDEQLALAIQASLTESTDHGFSPAKAILLSDEDEDDIEILSSPLNDVEDNFGSDSVIIVEPDEKANMSPITLTGEPIAVRDSSENDLIPNENNSKQRKAEDIGYLPASSASCILRVLNHHVIRNNTQIKFT